MQNRSPFTLLVFPCDQGTGKQLLGNSSMLPIFLDAEDTRTFLLYFLRLGEIGMHDSKVAGTRKYFPLKDGSALGGRKYQRYIPAAMLVISVL